MDPLTASAASGLRARLESLDLLANNVANASTGGYKADREFYSLYTSPEAQDSSAFSTMPLIERPWIDLSQGQLRPTGNSLDLAISGKGFFAVDGPSGPLYTRNGSFHLSPDGKLITQDGYTVKGATGPVVAQSTGPIDISPEGAVRQDGQLVGQLVLADFTDSAGLVKQGRNYFRAGATALSGTPSGATVVQSHLEDSNTGPAESAVRLVSLMRQFEMLQKAAQIGNDMSKQAIEQVAKV